MPKVNGERLLGDLKKLRSFGASGFGVVRRCLTPIDMESRYWLAERLREAGLEARIDGVANVIATSPNSGKALLIGSHTDTQPTGGWLDGAMGVIYGLEVARALRESEDTRQLPVDVASWADEEGHYVGLLGSRSFCGDMPQGVIDNATNASGHRLRDALSDASLAGVAVARLEPERYLGYLEAHIEQGPYLEAEQKRIGVVTAIIGMRDYEIKFSGRQNHAGTTPMHLRKDAGAALLDFAHRISVEFPAIAGERSVWTVGKVSFEPGAPSIIPGVARMVFQFRDPSESVLDRFEVCTYRLVEEANAKGSVRVEITLRDNSAKAAEMDRGLQSHLARAAEAHASGAWIHMPSGAAHDAQMLATRMPAGMLFVPSIGGVSHDFSEDTHERDIVLGCEVLATAAASLLLEANG